MAGKKASVNTVSTSAAAQGHASVQASFAARRLLPRVLVAHAEKSLRQLVKLHLACAGYDVVVAEDAVEAGRMVMREVPDLIILDVDMPYMDGVEFVSALRADGAIPLIPVIFLTLRESALERAERLGAAACLTAPLSSEVLLRAVARCLDQGDVRAGVRAPRIAAS
jgi:CheY-like chemotaxis protein